MARIGMLSAAFLLLAATTGRAKTIGREQAVWSVTGAGSSAALSEEGYQAVAVLKSDDQMKAFIRRLLDSQGRSVVDEGELSGFVPHFSGLQGVQDFGRLSAELKDAGWATSAKTEPAHEAKVAPALAEPIGHKANKHYQAAAKAHHRTPPTNFMTRVQQPAEEKKVKEQEDKQLVRDAGQKESPAQGDKGEEAKASPAEEKPTPAPPSRLPEVKSVLGRASNTMSEFSAQASSMKDRVAQEQSATKALLAEDKAKYEKQLAELKKKTGALNATIAQLRFNISALQATNLGLEKDAKVFDDANKIMVDAVKSMKVKTFTALEFLGDSVNQTDDSARPELTVLVSTTPKPDLDFFLAQARSELGLAASGSVKAAQASASAGVSLLQLVGPDADEEESSPEKKLVSLLSQSLANLATAKEKARNQLKEKFGVIMEAAEGRYAQLEATREALEQEQMELEARRLALIKAKDHLRGVGDQLIFRLQGFELFAKKVEKALSETEVAGKAALGA